jgi:hypothetical protein
MVALVKKILKKTNILKERAIKISDRLKNTPEGKLLKGLKLLKLSDFEVMGLPESSVITMTDHYYTSKSMEAEDKDIFETMIEIRKPPQGLFSASKTVKKLENILTERPQSLTEFIKKVVEVEQDVSLSTGEIEGLISEYKEMREIK